MYRDWTPDTPKPEIVDEISQLLSVQGLKVVEGNFTKPWGAYWRIDDPNINKFVELYFPNDPIEITKSLSQSPKILLVAPNARLSWQYHHRRQEIWKVVKGPVKAARSLTDDQTETLEYQRDALIRLAVEERHRLIGADSWGVVAEIWEHTDPLNPSNEEDNIRVQDDYGRQGSNDRGEAQFFK